MAPIVILIPAHNEHTTIGEVVRDIKLHQGYDVIVIDDASTDDTAHAARNAGAIVLPLSLKLGAWGATQTGIRYALGRGYRTAVTMDADGQHNALHIHALLKPLAARDADVAIGAYLARASRARRMAWSYFRMLTHLKLQDITSGFRAYNYAAMKVLASEQASLLDYQDVGVLLILRRSGLQITEVPVFMKDRTAGGSRVFSSWSVVGRYMLQTSLLCIARIGMNKRSIL